MPGKVKVKINSGKNLPVMDRSSDTTDAYVEIKLGSTTYKTDVCRKSLHPQWNSEWYRFEVDDSELQDEPLQIRLMDHDTYSANDAIGKVYLNLNPLLLPFNTDSAVNHDNPKNSVMSGWIPVYDTMHGIRGEVNLIVKVELFSDFNKFRQSSCGVQFFCSPTVPQGYHAQIIHGFVEELIVNDDPEYQWIDKIRTPRASNEARQTLFFKLSGELQRKIGVKALSLGGNAVIGYTQHFDLEGESGIVARGIGTAVTLVKNLDLPRGIVAEPMPEENNTPPPQVGDAAQRQSPELRMPSPAKLSGVPCIHRRSSDSDLSITPKGNSLTGSDRSAGGTSGHLMRANFALRSTLHQENFDMLEYPFLTMTKFPVGFIVQLGGAVSARSVKMLERITNVEEPESRDTWWSEIRMEIRSHARSLNCNAVLGYCETTSICEDVCVLSASGTAAIIGYHYAEEMEDSITGLPNFTKNKELMTTSLDRNNFADKKSDFQNKPLLESPEHQSHSFNGLTNSSCLLCHLPYDTKNLAIRATALPCSICSKGKVPDVLIATIEPPEGIPTVGRGCFLESFISRPLKDLKGESVAKDISDGLPFLEYELHRLLVNKLKIKGMNAIFGLKIRVSISEKMLMGIATGTAVFMSPFPVPIPPKLVSNQVNDESKLADLQKLLQSTIKKNRETYQLKGFDEVQAAQVLSDQEDSEDDSKSLDLLTGNKDCCILEVDDPQDAEIVNLLMEERPPDGFHVVNTEFVPGLDDLEIVKNLQMFTQIYRVKLFAPVNLNSHFRRLLQSVYFKLRRMVPCALCDLQFRIDLPEPDEIQLCVIGMALGLGRSQKKIKTVIDDDMIFKMEEDQIPENGVVSGNHLTAHSSLKYKQRSPSKSRGQSLKQRHIPHKERHGVDITPLSYVPGGKIERYLGNLNFFFIRETTSIREEGGLSGFIHSFMTEVLAIVRAHVTALGGNAMVSYSLTECVLHHNLHKNQGQCLINVGGDVVFVSYFKEEV